MCWYTILQAQWNIWYKKIKVLGIKNKSREAIKIMKERNCCKEKKTMYVVLGGGKRMTEKMVNNGKNTPTVTGREEMCECWSEKIDIMHSRLLTICSWIMVLCIIAVSEWIFYFQIAIYRCSDRSNLLKISILYALVLLVKPSIQL